jgi:hypothetical protein
MEYRTKNRQVRELVRSIEPDIIEWIVDKYDLDNDNVKSVEYVLETHQAYEYLIEVEVELKEAVVMSFGESEYYDIRYSFVVGSDLLKEVQGYKRDKKLTELGI